MPNVRIHPNLYTPIAIIVAGIIVAIAIMAVGHVGTNAPSTGTTTGTTPAVNVNADQVSATGNPTIGDANAPLTIAYWFDYQCPFCKENETNTMPQLVQNYVDTGKVKIVFKDFSFLGPDSDTLGHWARAVWALFPSKFYAWHTAIYQDQGEENTGWATTAEIEKITDTIFTAAQTAQIGQLASQDAAQYQNAMNADKQEGEQDGVQGTPALLIGNQMVAGYETYDQVKTVIDQQLSVLGK